MAQNFFNRWIPTTSEIYGSIEFGDKKRKFQANDYLESKVFNTILKEMNIVTVSLLDVLVNFAPNDVSETDIWLSTTEGSSITPEAMELFIKRCLMSIPTNNLQIITNGAVPDNTQYVLVPENNGEDEYGNFTASPKIIEAISLHVGSANTATYIVEPNLDNVDKLLIMKQNGSTNTAKSETIEQKDLVVPHSIYTGNDAPSGSLGFIGDVYLQTDSTDAYKFKIRKKTTDATWTTLLENSTFNNVKIAEICSTNLIHTITDNYSFYNSGYKQIIFEFSDNTGLCRTRTIPFEVIRNLSTSGKRGVTIDSTPYISIELENVGSESNYVFTVSNLVSELDEKITIWGIK